MAKKRVHEIAKDLKSHVIELDNKEVVTELLALGYDVKSHSSSLEDDQANAAIQRIVELRKPRAAPAPVAAKGFVVRPQRRSQRRLQRQRLHRFRFPSQLPCRRVSLRAPAAPRRPKEAEAHWAWQRVRPGNSGKCDPPRPRRW